MPSAPPAAYELKGDKLGSSMAEYLQRHSSDCVARYAAPPQVHRSILSGNKLEHADYQHVNAFRFACTNMGVASEVTLATATMNWQELEFSEQRLYLLAYYFDQKHFELVRAAFVLKFGPPTTTTEALAKNLLGAELPRTTITWKNEVSTIELSEMSGNDLTRSRGVLTLDEIYQVVSQRQGRDTVNAVQKDM
jgi:hypothetical protein